MEFTGALGKVNEDGAAETSGVLCVVFPSFLSSPNPGGRISVVAHFTTPSPPSEDEEKEKDGAVREIG